MNGDLEISLDKLPVRRLDAIEENGVEHFPSNDEGYEEKRVKLIRRIDFAWAVEREDQSKKRKTTGEADKAVVTTSQQQGQWQSLVENLKLAHEELSVIIDLINMVEANDAVTVAGMTRPKQLPNEHLSDLAVSTATKLQCFKNFGKYFKQSAKALEQKVTREARFYGALIRLQRNWKIKRHRLVAAASGNEGFFIDLFDSSLYDSAVVVRPSLSTVPIEHDAAGMLTVNVPRSSCHSLHFEILGTSSAWNTRKSGGIGYNSLNEDSSEETKKQHFNDDERVRDMHLTLREVHQAIHNEQVFDLVNREACNPSMDIYLSGMREKYLHISICQGASVSISLRSSDQDVQEDDESETNTAKTSHYSVGSFDKLKFEEGVNKEKQLEIPDQRCFEIYLRQLFHEIVFVKAKNKALSSFRSQIPGQAQKDKTNILGHFCMTLSHRILSTKVSSALENLVSKTPYVQLTSHPTWHSRMSSWTLSVILPQSILLAHSNAKHCTHPLWTKVVAIDDSITVEGEGAPNVVGLFEGKSKGVSSMDRHKCGLADLPIILLQQIASQIIQWLCEESLKVGIKASRDFLSLAFELDRGEIVRLVAHVDPEDDTEHGCISWWLTMDDGFYAEEHKLGADGGESEIRKYLGYLPLDVLYDTMLDFLNMCG